MEVENVAYSYKDGTVALNGVSASFSAGEIVGVVGRNGSGKTTLAKTLTGMLRPSSGRVLVEGKDYCDYSVAELGRKVGYVFQNPDYQLFSDSVENEVAFGLKNMGLDQQEIRVRTDNVLSVLSIEQYRDVHPRRLSFGERQRVAIASILAMKTKAIILDEPTAGQDFGKRQEIQRFLRQLNAQGVLVVLVSHDVSFVAACCHRVVALDEGEIVADGLTPEVLSDPVVLERIRFKPSPMMRLAKMLNQSGCPEGFLTVDQMALFVEKRIRREA